jgi:hypothetical protein
MWEEINKNKTNDISKINLFSEYFSISKNNLLELFEDGYQDAKNNKIYLDNILCENNKYYELNETGIEI